MQEGRRLIYTCMYLVLYNVMEGESVPAKYAKTILAIIQEVKGNNFYSAGLKEKLPEML